MITAQHDHHLRIARVGQPDTLLVRSKTQRLSAPAQRQRKAVPVFRQVGIDMQRFADHTHTAEAVRHALPDAAHRCGSGFSGTQETIARLEPDAALLEGKSISRNSIEGAEQEIIDWLDSIGMLNTAK